VHSRCSGVSSSADLSLRSVALARERPVAGVLLNAPYASVLRLFELRGPPLPYRLLLTDQFDSEALIGGIGVPVMILHGTADENVPVTEARRLYAAAREPKTMIEVEGAGHSAAWEGGQGLRRSRRSPLGPRRTPGPLSHGEPAAARPPTG
jgi:fermentation-respiration switch protein FrsA (DUF1100 family)